MARSVVIRYLTVIHNCGNLNLEYVNPGKLSCIKHEITIHRQQPYILQRAAFQGKILEAA